MTITIKQNPNITETMIIESVDPIKENMTSKQIVHLF